MGLRTQFLFVLLMSSVAVGAQSAGSPSPEAFRVLPPTAAGAQITPYLQYQTETAWREDDARLKVWDSVRTEGDLLRLQKRLRQKVLSMIGELPTRRTPLHSKVTGSIAMDGFHIEKLIFESLPGVYVTALVYIPDRHSGDASDVPITKHPAILVPAGHAENGKAHYQILCQRLALRGYVVISWDPVGQGERSQFWDAKAGRSRYNRICAEHAVLGNLAYLAGTNLARWEIWDGLRAFDYLLTRQDVDPDRINITGTSGGGFQAIHIAALEPRIKVAVPSCYITSLPMRVHNRIFQDPDSDPEQDLYGMISNGVDNAGLLVLMYPRPVFVAAATLDFFPIEGTRKAFREVFALYGRFNHAHNIAMAESYNGHQYSDENQEAAFEFLDHFNGMPRRTALAPAKELDDKTVQCTRTGQVMLDFEDARSLLDVIRDYYLERRGKMNSSMRQLYYGSGYPGISNWEAIPYSGIAPQHQIAWETAGKSIEQDIAIDRYVLRHSGNLILPLLHFHRTAREKHRCLFWFSKDGKASMDDWPEILRYVEAGFDVVSFDFRGRGETRMPYKALSEDDPSFARLDLEHAYVNPLSSVLAGYVYNSLLTGRPYFLQMIEDFEIAHRFSQSVLGETEFSVVSDEEDMPIASAVAAIFPGIKNLPRTGTHSLKWSDLVTDRREQWPIQYLLPGAAYIQ